MEQTANSVKGIYILLFILTLTTAALWTGMSMVYAALGMSALVVTGFVFGFIVFVWCLNTWEKPDLGAFINQKETIIGLNATCDKQQVTLSRMLAHENDQSRLIDDMMKVLSMEDSEVSYASFPDQLTDARRVVARMKASIVAVRKVDAPKPTEYWRQKVREQS